MSRIGDTKPNATGRSSGRVISKIKKQQSPPGGEPWVWLSRSMLESPAWAALSINARRILDRLILEHMAHAGSENGNLIATHDQFRQFGASCNQIKPAIDELVFLGVIRVQRGGRWAGKNTPSKYRLTWLGDCAGASPTNEWRHVTTEQIDAWQKQRSELRKAFRNSAKIRDFPKKRKSTVPSLSIVPSGKSDEAE